MLTLTVHRAGGGLRHGIVAEAVAQGGNLAGLFQVADFADVVLKARLGAGGVLDAGDLAPAVALRGDNLVAVQRAADRALAVSRPAVVGAGGLLLLHVDPGVAHAAAGELVLIVKGDNGVLDDLFPVGLFPVFLALLQLAPEIIDRLVIGLLRAHAADCPLIVNHIDAGFPVYRGLDAGIVALLDEIFLFLNRLKEVVPRRLNNAYDLPAVSADGADHLHIAVHAALGRDFCRLKGADMPLRVRRRQRDQRQAHQKDKQQGQTSHDILFHFTKPLDLRKNCNLS